MLPSAYCDQIEQVLFAKYFSLLQRNQTVYCYHLVSVINVSLFQSDHIKRYSILWTKVYFSTVSAP